MDILLWYPPANLSRLNCWKTFISNQFRKPFSSLQQSTDRVLLPELESHDIHTCSIQKIPTLCEQTQLRILDTEYLSPCDDGTDEDLRYSVFTHNIRSYTSRYSQKQTLRDVHLQA